MEPKVTLLDHTSDPIGTLYRIWNASRDSLPVPSEQNCKIRVVRDAAEKLFVKILDAGIPVAENIDFVFLLEGVSIALREQMVRHRIGVHAGERLGCDMVPDLADSTWWSQSMRILDMKSFAKRGAYHIPAFKTEEQRDMFCRHMKACADLYAELVETGVPMEDAREVLPLAVTHRITWKLNLAALKHIVGQRGCWILQSGLWGPIISGMVDELCAKIHPMFRRLITPPCIDGCEFRECKFKLDNERRVTGDDEIPPCPLYLTNHGQDAAPDEGVTKWWDEHTMRDRGKVKAAEHVVTWRTSDAHASTRMAAMVDRFRKLWARDPWTGERVADHT